MDQIMLVRLKYLFINVYKWFTGLTDGTINAWSALSGSLLCAVNIGFSIADMLVASNGCRLIIRSDELNTIPILGITHKPTQDTNGKMPKRKLLKPNKDESECTWL
jgi:hypothetical protein